MSGKSARKIALFFAIATVALALYFDWSARRHREGLRTLIREIEGWGCKALPYSNDDPPWPFLRRVFAHSTVQSLAGSGGYYVEGPRNRQLSREQLAMLLDFRPIRTFTAMSSTNLDDEWVEGIRDPGKVQQLNLMGTAITDRSVAALLQMKALNELNISATRVSEEAVERLMTLPRLYRLKFGGPNVRAVRLLDLWTVDASGGHEDRASRATRLLGRVAIDPKLGRPTSLDVMGYQLSKPGGFRRQIKKLVEESVGVYEFDLRVAPFSPGASNVRTDVHCTPAGRTIELICELPKVVLKLAEHDEPNLGQAH